MPIDFKLGVNRGPFSGENVGIHSSLDPNGHWSCVELLP